MGRMDKICPVSGEKKEKVLTCSACKSVSYCSPEHQKTHWASHKKDCKNIREACSKKSFVRIITQEGSGEAALPGEKVIVDYTGKFANGQVFDSSIPKGRKFEFNVGRGMVIQAWDEGIGQMKVGEKCILYCSPEVAYGAHGAGGVIPGNCVLIFEVERHG